MHLLFYTLRTLLRGRGSNAIKIISLGLGLTISILMFSRVAYEQSYDACFQEVERVYQAWGKFAVNGEEYPLQQHNMGPVGGMFLTEFPENVEAATSAGTWTFSDPLYLGKQRYDINLWMVDSLFFRTLGIEVVKGHPVSDLQQPNVLYLSESKARQIFGDANPVGKTLSYGHHFDLTVRGLYRDIPENATVKPEGVVSFPSMEANQMGGNYSWEGGDSWLQYIRLRPGGDVDKLNKAAYAHIEQHIGPKEERPYDYNVILKPLRDTYRTQDDVKMMTRIMLAMGLAILFIVTFNYVLISISSLGYRAKAVGVHKCNGAGNGRILAMFLAETALIILAALVLMAVLIIGFKDFVEDTTSVHLAMLFAPERIWVSLVVIGFLFVVGGVLPGRLFTRIPVTQVFCRSVEGRKGWKRALLCVQFAGVAFISGLMCVVMAQYHYVLNKDMGYNPYHIAAGYFSPTTWEESEAGRRFFEGLPYVEALSNAYSSPLDGYSGSMVTDEGGKAMFSTQHCFLASPNYFEMMGFTMLQGKLTDDRKESVVNETFARMMHWGNEVIGRRFTADGESYTVTGLVKDFQIGNLKNSEKPFICHGVKSFWATVFLRLKEPFAENLQRLNQDVKEAFPTMTIDFVGYEDAARRMYNSERVFRNATLVAAVALFFVMLMGLVGYVADEVRRRSKEIAVRKVNGAETGDILCLLATDVLKAAVPSVLVGCVAAWYVNGQWLDSFAHHADVPAVVYLGIALANVAVIAVCVVAKAWKIANENPVLSIKSE